MIFHIRFRTMETIKILSERKLKHMLRNKNFHWKKLGAETFNDQTLKTGHFISVPHTISNYPAYSQLLLLLWHRNQLLQEIGTDRNK